MNRLELSSRIIARCFKVLALTMRTGALDQPDFMLISKGLERVAQLRARCMIF